MAGKIRNEDLQLNIIVNGDAGRKQMLELDRSIHDVKTSIKATETKLRELNKAGKDGTKEYLALDNPGKQNHIRT